MPKLGQRGDTIVEVLICLAVLSLIIGTAYSIANRSLINIRRSQERTEATKLAEKQLERVRYAVYDQGVNLSTAPANFCINDDLVSTTAVPTPNNLGSSYPAACKSGLYHWSTNLNTGSANLYTITVRWDGLTGGQEEVKLYYRAF